MPLRLELLPSPLPRPCLEPCAAAQKLHARGAATHL